MLRKTSNLFLAVILLLVNTPSLPGQTDPAASDRRIKTQINKLGPGAKVTVILKDGTKVRGSISQILDDSFDVTISKQTQSSIISYRDVTDVKRRGWTSGAKIALGVGIGAAVIAAVVAAMVANADIGEAFP